MLRKEKQLQREAYLKMLEEEQAAKNEDRMMLIHELATSDKSAKAILAGRQAISLKKTSMRKTEVKATSSSTAPSLLTDTYWRMQRDEEMDRQREEEEDMASDDFDSIQSSYMDVDLGVGYVTSVNINKAHGGGLQYPLLSSSIGVKDLYVEPTGVGSLTKQAKAGGYRLAFGYERAIQDAHTALFLPSV